MQDPPWSTPMWISSFEDALKLNKLFKNHSGWVEHWTCTVAMDPMYVWLNPHFRYHEGACVLRRRGSSKAEGELFRDDWLLLLSSTWTISPTFKNLKVAAAAAAIPQILLQNSTKTIIRCVYKTASYAASRTAWSRACNVVGLGSRGSGQMFFICCKIWDCQQH
jgi:hypothetical protein